MSIYLYFVLFQLCVKVFMKYLDVCWPTVLLIVVHFQDSFILNSITQFQKDIIVRDRVLQTSWILISETI